ncbi:MAG: hypothetical protein L0Y71_09725 [Gemmataceae bacterium]|nr:hypothetical protein [Gemmataceae bacterium]
MRWQQPKAAARRRGSAANREAIRQTANGYIVRIYPFGCMGGEPRRLVGKTGMWIVPVILTSPGYGAVGEVGLVAVAANTHEIVSATPRQEAVAALKHLREVHGRALEAAFHQARTV